MNWTVCSRNCGKQNSTICRPSTPSRLHFDIFGIFPQIHVQFSWSNLWFQCEIYICSECILIPFVTDNYKAYGLYQYLFVNLAPLPCNYSSYVDFIEDVNSPSWCWENFEVFRKTLWSSQKFLNPITTTRPPIRHTTDHNTLYNSRSSAIRYMIQSSRYFRAINRMRVHHARTNLPLKSP